MKPGDPEVPGSPCQLCGQPLSLVEDWPEAGQARWLCPTCAAAAPPSLRHVYEALSGADRTRLHQEIGERRGKKWGLNTLAQRVLAELGDLRG